MGGHHFSRVSRKDLVVMLLIAATNRGDIALKNEEKKRKL